MKKILLLAAAFIMLSIGSINAQSAAPRQATTPQQGAPAGKPAQATQTHSKSADASGKHLTKDGKLDKRFKENKSAAAAPKTAGPTKKDGTPDMRYKENKGAAKHK